MAQSDVTTKYKRGCRITALISFLLSFGPLIYFVAVAFMNGDARQKFTIGGVAMLAIVLTIVMQLFKFKLSRTIFWLLGLAAYWVMQNMTVFLIVFMVTSVVDELVVEPLHKHYKNLYKTNKIIDQRIA